jgi:hypothetical protein
MSYLAQPTSIEEYGVTKVGDFIEVTDGVISLLQDVSPTADVEFNTLEALGYITSEGNIVITSIAPSAGAGIAVDSVISDGPSASFTISNTGVLSLTAGNGISLSGSTGDITITSTGADFISVVGVATNYTATITDEYIGVNSASAVTITLPLGEDGRVYYIKDEKGQGSGKITVQPQLGEQIDNANSYVISVPYQSVSVVFRAGQWRII